jgi:hypothetical protein
MEIHKIRFVLFLCGCVAFLSLYATQGILPQLARAFGIDAEHATLSITMATLAVAMVAPFVGMLKQRLEHTSRRGGRCGAADRICGACGFVCRISGVPDRHGRRHADAVRGHGLLYRRNLARPPLSRNAVLLTSFLRSRGFLGRPNESASRSSRYPHSRSCVS